MREISDSAIPHPTSNPPVNPLFRPVPFWSWNEQMRVDELIDQIKLIKSGGWGGGFVHARIGLTIPYLGRNWFEAVDATLQTCEKLDLGVWLYDEDTWPSGFSGGSVPARGAQHRMKALLARPVEQSPPPDCQPIGQPHAGLQVYCWTAPLGNPWFYGSCYADLLNPDTVQHFLHDAYDSYFARYPQHYGKLISAQFTDEPSPIFRLGLPRGCLPYSPVVIARYEQQYHQSPFDEFHKLFAESPDAHIFRIRYFRTINTLFEQNFSQQLGQWCERHEIGLTGHFMSEHSLYDQTLWGTNVMPQYRHQAIPGIDHLARQVDDIATAKQCQSVVNQYGKKRMLSELYGVSGQSLSFADRWWIASQQIGLGVNLLNPHLALYTMSGCRKRDYPPNLFYQQPWWPLNNVLDDALSRLCEIMADGTCNADILVLHPIESATSLWRGSTVFSEPEAVRQDVWDHLPVDPDVRIGIEELDKQFKSVLASLAGAQRTFDLGDETILSQDATVETIDGRPVMRVGKMGYRAILIPRMLTMRLSTLELLEQFLAAGGIVIWDGQLINVEGVYSDRLQTILKQAIQCEPEKICQTLHSVLPADVYLTATPAVKNRILFHHRKIEDGALIYLTNLSRTESDQNAVCHVAGDWNCVEQFNPFTGLWQIISASHSRTETQIPITLHPTQTHCLRISNKDAPHRAGPIRKWRDSDDPHHWAVTRLDDNALTLDAATWQENDQPESASPLPVIAIHKRLTELGFSGSIRLGYTFTASAEAVGRRVWVVIENPDQYQITVNGSTVQYAGLPHWRDIRWLPIDITDHVQQGQNRIELFTPVYQPAQRQSPDATLRYGTEIESIYLVGDFSVANPAKGITPVSQRWESYGLPPVSQSEICPDQPLTIDAPQPLTQGDLTRQGLPFYAGAVRYSTLIDHSDTPRLLKIERLDAAVAAVQLNGQEIGHLISDPFECVIPPGEGELTLTLYSTLRNLLGPHHHPEGELAAVTPAHFEPRLPAAAAQAVKDWADRTYTPDDWSDAYHLVAFGDCGRISIHKTVP